MATATVGHHPELTNERARDVFEKHFGGKYEVYQPMFLGLGRYFAVQKSRLELCLVRVEQKGERTQFNYRGQLPMSPLTFPLYIPAAYIVTWVFMKPR